MHVELNDDIEALYARPCTIREMTRADRTTGIGATAVRHAFNIPDVYVYLRCRIPSAAT